jgi:hypothetical protein
MSRGRGAIFTAGGPTEHLKNQVQKKKREVLFQYLAAIIGTT